MGSDQRDVAVYPPPGDGPPYVLVSSGESGMAVEAMPVTAGEGEGVPPPDSDGDPAAAMIPERRTEWWRKPA
jgi:hypothetical protein